MANLKHIYIIGAGPAGLMAADYLSKQGYKPIVVDSQKAAGRKFLVAGKGGFNLTNAMEEKKFPSLYWEHAEKFKNFFKHFSPSDTIEWLKSIQIPTYIGSSNRVFPEKGIKPIIVLNNWINQLKEQGVEFLFEHRFMDFSGDSITLKNSDNENIKFKYDALVLALGGKSWSVTGLDGSWTSILKNKGIITEAFKAANCGIEIDQFNSEVLGIDGKWLKNIALSIEDHYIKGDLVITKYGIEGTPAYYLSNFITKKEIEEVYLDLKPSFSTEKIYSILENSTGNITKVLKDKLNLSGTAIALTKAMTTKEQFQDIEQLSQLLNRLPLKVSGLRPIEEAISSSGGISFNALNEDLMIKSLPGVFVCGEMVDWDAPTGGFLLQGCFSMGWCVGMGVRSFLVRSDSPF